MQSALMDKYNGTQGEMMTDGATKSDGRMGMKSCAGQQHKEAQHFRFGVSNGPIANAAD